MIEIKDKKDCCGCTSCYAKCPVGAISMIEDEEGFKYPVVDKEKCINCGLCEKVCPQKNDKIRLENKSKPNIYACKSFDDKNKKESSSGGIFQEIAKYVLSQEGVVYGAGFDKELNVIHKSIEKLEDLNLLKGSKYVQSFLGDTYKKVQQNLKKDRIVLFVGTPCQVAGLYSFLENKEYDNLITLDLICHGVPSPKVYKKYLKELSSKYKSKPTSVNFRDKTEGWKNFSMKINFENNSKYRKNLTEDIYMKLFLRNIMLRETCYECKFSKLPRVADITLGDYWGVKNKYPEIDLDDKGVSEIIINSKKGEKIFNIIENNIEKILTDFDFGLKSNLCINNSVKQNKNRQKFFENLDKYDLENLQKKYCPDPTLIEEIYRKTMTTLGKVKRKILKIYSK